MARRLALLVVAAAVGVASAPVAAEPLPVPSVVLAGPGGFAAGYAGPLAVSVQGQSLLLVNGDVAPHNVVSRATTLKRVKVGTRYRTVRTRLFASADVDLGGTADVVGVSRLKPGSYAFLCSIHPNMTGTLEVQPAP